LAAREKIRQKRREEETMTTINTNFESIERTARSNKSATSGHSLHDQPRARYSRQAIGWLIVALILFLVSAVGASLVQTDGGRVEIQDMRWETPSGYMLSALLFKPDTATVKTPAPVIVASHGMLNSREMQDSTYVELARRGYVVVAIDMYGHGFSQIVTGPQRDASRGTGLYDAVDLVAKFPYIDKNKIGITGHSFGGRSANWSVDIDNTVPNPLVSAVLLQSADATYIDPKTKKFFNAYRSRDVAIIAAKYDEFFFREKRPDGTMTIPGDFLSTKNAQSFLHFGAAPEDFQDVRAADTVYTQSVDGRQTTRAIYTVSMTHPWVPFSAASTSRVIEFFDRTFGAPTPIAKDSQTWQRKEAFNAVGLVAFAIFLVAFTKIMLATPAFANLAVERETEATAIPTNAGRAWLWGGLVASAAFSAISYMALFQPVQDLQPGFRTQYPPLFVGIWAAANGLFALLFMVLYYRSSGKRQGLNLRSAGVVIGLRQLGQTILLAAIVVSAAYLIVFAGDYFLKIDFRLWVLAIKSFNADHIPAALKMLPLFAIYFVINSVAINSFNRFTLFGKEWLNTVVIALFNALGGIVILLLQYVTFFRTGEMHPMIQAMESIYMLPIVVILFVTAIVSRKIYRATNNPYLGGLINAVVVTLISIANTQTLT
jgi:dienelactone hydrolase